MSSLQNNNYFPSFKSPIFHSKIHKHPGPFFEMGCGTHKNECMLGERVHIK